MFSLDLITHDSLFSLCQTVFLVHNFWALVIRVATRCNIRTFVREGETKRKREPVLSDYDLDLCTQRGGGERERERKSGRERDVVLSDDQVYK